MLGLWTITAPLTFGYGLDPAPLAREVWLNTQARIWAMTASDLVSGLLLVVFGCRSLTPGRPVSEWLGCGVGIWMSTVPVLFWARAAAAYQLGYIDHVWDPLFGEASERVLSSDMSHMWPVSDGALSAFSYTFEFLMGWMGAPSRWRTMLWMVTLFGILVLPLGLAHIVLIISQPVVVGSSCTMCLLAAAIMLPMIPLEADEVIAMGQHVRRRVRAGESVWDVFWRGGDGKAADPDRRSPAVGEFPERPGDVTHSSLWGSAGPDGSPSAPRSEST